MTKKRKRDRSKDLTCTCDAYEFPHRFGGGRCDGKHVVCDYWNAHMGSGDCTDCHSLVNDTINYNLYCEVEAGQEDRLQCPVLQEFLHFNEQKLKR